MATPPRAISRDKRLHRPSTKLTGHATPVLAADWFADSSRLVSAASKDSRIHVWDVDTARTVSTVEISKGVENVRLFPTGDRLVATFDENIRVYALASGEDLAGVRHGTRARALEVAPNGDVYWAGFGDSGGEVWVWRPGSNPKPLLTGLHTFEPTCDLSLSRDGAEVWCFFEWDLVGFDTRTGVEVGRLEGDRSAAFGPGFVLPPGRRIVCAKSLLNRDDEPVRPRLFKWDLESGVSPNERYVAVGLSNGALVIHDLGDAVVDPKVVVPRIARRSMLDNPLLLRLQRRPGLWLRVHANGDLEQAQGDARTDSVITPLVARAGQDRPSAVHPSRLASALSQRLWSHDLTKPAPWSGAHAVQVFIGAELIVEGWLGGVGAEGGAQDILGVDSDPDGVAERVDGDIGAREILAGIEELLTRLPAV